ncbi:CRISPR-associated protein [Marinobacterium aestuarii]|uniref:CRISPR-associated protein n=2 Tax=Marinobacterium aestuarii TaxID=1821621 RepID=A0A1A9EX33_9GAMM|nr:CRISPR-associated protein [Marinobacterium aestuarii]
MSPAVITETLYAIARDGLRWPDRIKVITTTVGRDQLHDLQTTLDQLAADYGCTPLAPAQVEIDVVRGADGLEVSDARSLEDHEALGDFIMQCVRNLTDDPDRSVHASIAGGRKTMTFYLGYAMSLLGRPGDLLSHVLVSEPFESVKAFRYPTPYSQALTTFAGQTVDARDAQVVLADIPFIRMRDELPPLMLQLTESLSFRDLVSLINLGELEAHKRTLTLELPADMAELRVLDGAGTLLRRIELGMLDYAFYRMVLRQYLAGEELVRRPALGDTDLLVLLCEEALRLQGEIPGKDQTPTELLGQLEDAEGPYRLRDSTLNSLRTNALTGTFFDTRCNSIKSALESVLPRKLCRWLTLCSVSDEDGDLANFYQAWGSGSKGGGYGIPLAASSIILHD